MKKRKIERVYIPYTQWECYKNGMWRKLPKSEEEAFENIAFNFTSSWELYGSAMLEVAEKWPLTMINSLTASSTNKKAFIGHCACSFKLNIPEYIVRRVWGKLTDKQRIDADDFADMVYLEWVEKYERENRAIYRNLEGEVLL